MMWSFGRSSALVMFSGFWYPFISPDWVIPVGRLYIGRVTMSKPINKIDKMRTSEIDLGSIIEV